MSTASKFMIVLATLLSIVTVGCASKPKVLPAQPHQPVPGAQVKIYQKAPKEYEQLGTVTLKNAPQYKWDQRGDADAAMQELQKRAGAMGANGLLLQALPGQASALVGVGYMGNDYEIPVDTKATPHVAVAQAIYVIKK